VAILRLHSKGLGIKRIARALKVSKNTVRKVLASGTPEVPPLVRAESLDEHRELIEELFLSCEGNRVRVHEELVKELAEQARRVGREPPEIPYSTLTGYCRRHGIGVTPRKPSGVYYFEPGEEMQFDTSPHKVVLGGEKRLLQCASLVLCHSRRMFIQCYPTFNKFYARVFLSAAAAYFQAMAHWCMIDNSSVVVAGGSGETARFQPELEALAKYLGFRFRAHEPGDANRSARVERGRARRARVRRRYWPLSSRPTAARIGNTAQKHDIELLALHRFVWVLEGPCCARPSVSGLRDWLPDSSRRARPPSVCCELSHEPTRMMNAEMPDCQPFRLKT